MIHLASYIAVSSLATHGLELTPAARARREFRPVHPAVGAVDLRVVGQPKEHRNSDIIGWTTIAATDSCTTGCLRLSAFYSSSPLAYIRGSCL
ncbi:hypothetical protein BDV11DRAFT_192366 [Aspergillus similis]